MINNPDENDYLSKFYYELRNNLRREKASKSNSILIAFLETTSTVRFELLNKSSISSNHIPNDILFSLLSKNYIQVLGKMGMYAITAKGVWEREKNMNVIDEERLLSFINSKFFTDKFPFTGEGGSDLDDKESTILFAMISARAFSENSLADLKVSETVKDKWLEILQKSFELLAKLNVLKRATKNSFFDKTGNEHVASSLFRHNGYMLQKTKGIYQSKGKYQYYLDLYDGKIFSTENLSYLFWKIFKGNISIEDIDLIAEYCKATSIKESIFLFKIKEHIFSMPEYDIKLKDSLIDSISSKTKWEKIV